MAFCSQAGDFSLIAFRPSAVCRLRCFFSTRLMVLAAGLSGQRLLAAAWLKKSTNGARHWLAERGVNHDPNMLDADYRDGADEAGSSVAGAGRRPAGLAGSNDDSPAQRRAICFASRQPDWEVIHSLYRTGQLSAPGSYGWACRSASTLFSARPFPLKSPSRRPRPAEVSACMGRQGAGVRVTPSRPYYSMN